MSLSKAQATWLADFICDVVRPDWDRAGVVHALGEARSRGDAGAVAVAAILAARDGANRTPGVIPLAGPHWAVTAATRPRPATPPRSRTCGICYMEFNQCRTRWSWDHQFESLEDVKRRTIAAADRAPERRIPTTREDDNGEVRRIEDVELPYE